MRCCQPFHLGLLAGIALIGGVPSSARAEFNLTPAESRILEFLDRNGDGQLDGGEFEKLPVPMRLWLRDRDELTDREPISLMEFAPSLRTMLADLREGRYSVGTRAKPGELAATPRAPREPRKKRPPVKSEWRSSAEYVFGLMDVNKDGKLDGNEWGRSRTVRPWFEQEGRTFKGEMSRSEFVGHMIEMQRRLDQSAPK